jgi:hypothetical protein
MPSLGIRPTSITLFPTAADRSTIPASHQQHYLSPPLTPYPHLHGYDDTLKSSPPSSYHPSLPTLREMLPLESRQQHSPSDPEQHAYVHPAPQPHSQRDLTELSDLNHDTAPRGVQHATDPSRIISHYSSQSHNGVVQSASISPLLRRNKAHVASACVNCKKAHLACDGTSSLSLFFRLSTSLFLFSPSFPVFSLCLLSPIIYDPRRSHGMWICMSGGICAQAPNIRILFLFCCACVLW